jgi:hypothetical protein
MGPFRGIGSNKKEARNVASSKAIDFIFQKLAPFRKQWEFYHKVRRQTIFIVIFIYYVDRLIYLKTLTCPNQTLYPPYFL